MRVAQRAAAADAGRSGAVQRNITSEQVDDLSGVISKAMMIPGVPDWVKLGVVKKGMAQVVGAVNSGALPPEMRAQVVAALGDGLVSERLADQIVAMIAPQFDLPILNEEQERELLKNIVSALLVQHEDFNIFGEAAKGSAKFVATQGKGAIQAMSELRSDASRASLAKRLAADIDLPVLGPEAEEEIVRKAVDAMAGVILSKVPAEALEAAVGAGGNSTEVEEFLVACLAKEINVPFVSMEQKSDVARGVVRGWLGLVDQEELAREQRESLEQRRQWDQRRAELSKGMLQLGESGATGLRAVGSTAIGWLQALDSRGSGQGGGGVGDGPGGGGGGGGSDGGGSKNPPGAGDGDTRDLAPRRFAVVFFLAATLALLLALWLRRRKRRMARRRSALPQRQGGGGPNSLMLRIRGVIQLGAAALWAHTPPRLRALVGAVRVGKETFWCEVSRTSMLVQEGWRRLAASSGVPMQVPMLVVVLAATAWLVSLGLRRMLSGSRLPAPVTTDHAVWVLPASPGAIAAAAVLASFFALLLDWVCAQRRLSRHCGRPR